MLKNRLTASEMGCYLSHLDIWLGEFDSQKEREVDMPVIIFEDDIGLRPDFSTVEIQDALAYLADKQWDIFFFGFCAHKCESSGSQPIRTPDITKINFEQSGGENKERYCKV